MPLVFFSIHWPCGSNCALAAGCWGGGTRAQSNCPAWKPWYSRSRALSGLSSEISTPSRLAGSPKYSSLRSRVMLVLCCHGSVILNGPLPTGMSLYSLLSAAPATSGTGLKTVCVVLASNSQSAAASATLRVFASSAVTPLSSVADPR
jgi:hypothetical protein